MRSSATPPPLPADAKRPGRARALAGALAVLLFLIFMALWEGQLPDLTREMTRAIGGTAARLGHYYSYPLLCIEEAGIPLPIPGDVLVMMVGNSLRNQPVGAWLEAWALGLVAILLGASTLYGVSRRLGRDLPNTRLGRLLHVTPTAMRKAEEWFGRWGPWALIFGRHVPGFRIVLSVVAAMVGMSYRVFILSVALSSAAWVAIFLYLGYRVGGVVARLLDLHRGYYALLPLLFLFAALAYAFLRTSHAQTPTGQAAEAAMPKGS